MLFNGLDGNLPYLDLIINVAMLIIPIGNDLISTKVFIELEFLHWLMDSFSGALIASWTRREGWLNGYGLMA